MMVAATVVFVVFAVVRFHYAWEETTMETKTMTKTKTETETNADVHSLMEWARQVQERIHGWNMRQGIVGDEGAVIEAMSIGYREGLGRELKEKFSRSGVSHILALSGFHVGIIYFILQLVFLKRLVGHKWKWITQLMIVGMLWCYALIAGMSPSVVRAVLMCSLLSISKLHTGTLVSWRTLLMAGIIMYVFDPLIVLEIGFVLSFVSMIGIYLLGLKMIELYEGYCFVDRFVWVTVSLTISCTLFTLPIVSYTFGNIATMGIVSNIIVTSVVYILFVIYALFLLCMAFTTLLGWGFVMPVCEWLREGMMACSSSILKVVDYISGLDFSCINYRFSVVELILYYVVLSMVMVLFRTYIRNVETKRYENVV